ncbi:hypothetical protein [Streptomyces chartreusis]|uniref:hypothetical protein n=1 Tax=Streptomyces chartreusis TaxID=1969 RepID=UPI00380554FC
MPQPTLPAQPEGPLVEDVILGADAHKDVHVVAVITVLGALQAHQEFPATAAGYRQLLAWGRSFGACAELVSSAPDPSERPWHAS